MKPPFDLFRYETDRPVLLRPTSLYYPTGTAVAAASPATPVTAPVTGGHAGSTMSSSKDSSVRILKKSLTHVLQPNPRILS
jgi:hypothetical protein